MKDFMDEDFLLETDTARELFHGCAEGLGIIDFHNHLDPSQMLQDFCYDNIGEAWLGGDHYKWRAMRADGFSEELVTGRKRGTREQFDAWAKTVQDCFGNPLYHWTHLELQRYFGIKKPLSPETAQEIWETCNEKLKTPKYCVSGLLKMQKVEILCTTDDPADDLKNHRALKEKGYPIQVLPTFRPEKAVNIESPDFPKYMERLSEVWKGKIKSVETLAECLRERLGFFVENGCRTTDHSLEGRFFLPSSKEEVEDIFQKRMAGGTLTGEESAKYRGYLLSQLGREYARNGLVMQLHIGAMRNNSSRMFEKLGPDHGFDSPADFGYARELSALLDSMDRTGELPRTVLYYLNPKDADMLAGIAGNFQANEEGIRGKVQLGTAWWFCDHKKGMERQMEALQSCGLLSTFIGMLTDSRSFLSFPRHEYFRRILCNLIGMAVEAGEYPRDMEYLKKMVYDICYGNAKEYFGF